MLTAITKAKVMMLINPSRLGNSLPLHKSETAVNKHAYIEETSGNIPLNLKYEKISLAGLAVE